MRYGMTKLKTNERKVKAVLDPRLTELVGDKLMASTRDQGRCFVVKNLDTHLTLYDIACMLKASVGWNVRPDRFLKSYRGKNNVVVFTEELPPDRCFPISGTDQWIVVSEFVPAALVADSSCL